jgi:HlyD family secretion protein
MLWRIREWFLSLTGMTIAFLTLSSFLIASYEMDSWPFGDYRPLRERHLFSRVRRTDLVPRLNAPGRVESSRRTIIRCELENLAGSGASASAGSASTLIWVLPEGSPIQRGDVLARLDGATYEEMLRQQTITIEQAKASRLQAQLDHEIAMLAVREYLEGTVQETLKGMEGAIALARSDFSRAEERLSWTKRMKEKGYASAAQIVTDKQTVATLDLALKRQLSAYDLFQRFTMPMMEKTLRGDVMSARTSLNNEILRLNRQLERFELLKKQVERCTIRAPHDGVLYYQKNNRRGPNSQNAQIEEGMAVRQKQELFFLPDLTQMEIQVALNESVVNWVNPGFRAEVTFEALPNLRLPGKVSSVNQIPVQQGDRGEDIHYFFATIKLDHSAPGLKPGMSARVEIIRPERARVLAIPYEAIVWDHGKNVCYVAEEEDLQRREVQLGQATTELVEVTGGLQEGEEVALDPPRLSVRPEPLIRFGDANWSSRAPSTTVVAPGEKQAADRKRFAKQEFRKTSRRSSDGPGES